MAAKVIARHVGADAFTAVAAAGVSQAMSAAG